MKETFDFDRWRQSQSYLTGVNAYFGHPAAIAGTADAVPFTGAMAVLIPAEKI